MVTVLDLSLGLKVKWPVIPSQPVLEVKGTRLLSLPFMVTWCAIVMNLGLESQKGQKGLNYHTYKRLY